MPFPCSHWYEVVSDRQHGVLNERGLTENRRGTVKLAGRFGQGEATSTASDFVIDDLRTANLGKLVGGGGEVGAGAVVGEEDDLRVSGAATSIVGADNCEG